MWLQLREEGPRLHKMWVLLVNFSKNKRVESLFRSLLISVDTLSAICNPTVNIGTTTRLDL